MLSEEKERRKERNLRLHRSTDDEPEIFINHEKSKVTV
jgi:hypothetical protein